MKILPLFIFGFSFLVGCTSSKPDPDSHRDNSPNSFTTKGSKPKTDTDPNDYYENGNIRIEKIIEGNHEHWIFKQEDGGCWEEKFFKDGDEYKRIVYNSNCTKSAEYELKNGNRNGEWISYNENGTIREKGFYENGLPIGGMIFKDEEGKQSAIYFYFHKDSITTTFLPMENEYNKVKKYLTSHSIDFKEEENIEVAGKKDYHFPILKWGLNSLNFGMKENHEIVKCESGYIEDSTLTFFSKIKIGMSFIPTCHLLNVSAPHKTNKLIIYDLKLEMTYTFSFNNDILQSVSFEHTTKAY